jgi:hypothetical protein
MGTAASGTWCIDCTRPDGRDGPPTPQLENLISPVAFKAAAAEPQTLRRQATAISVTRISRSALEPAGTVLTVTSSAGLQNFIGATCDPIV